MQTGEVLRREVFNLLDAAKGGRLKKLKEVNKHEIVEGVTEDYMERRVQTLLSYVKQHSPYYKEHPEWTKLEDFPVMTKGDFIEHYDEVLVDCVREQGNLYRLSTSGSTGTPFTVLCDGDKMSRVNMNFISCMELNGFRMGMKRGEFRAWIKGKNTISKWKSFENGFIAIQLDEDPEYTVDLYNFYPEILKLDSDEPAEPGELGRIVVTDYYNKTFPMVRYDTGDTGKMRVYYDKNGRVHAKYTEIYGRRGSLMYNTKGEPLSIHVFMNTLLKFEGTVYQAKCIQWGEKDYELLVNADRSRLDETELLAAYRHYLGEDAELRITYVDQIPIQASGKFMVCENKWNGRKQA